MGRTRFAILALAVLCCTLGLAACGGGGSKSSAAQTTAASSSTGGKQSSFTGDPCTKLSSVVMDLGEADATGTGFDYAGDRSFLDGYADRAPGGVAASVRRLRDILDKYASAAQDAGLANNADPSEDQLAKIKSKLSYSSDDQAANAQAIDQVTIFAGTSC